MMSEFKIAPTPLPRKLRELITFVAGDRSYRLLGKHVGMISPIKDVTEHWAQVQKGKFFCFAHPADETKRDYWRAEVSKMGFGAEEMKVVEAFFTIGGFLIFDGYMNLVEVQACLNGPGLKLRKGQTVDCRPLVIALKDRLGDTTILKLAERNLKFAWLLPREEIGKIKAGKSGAFVYLSEEYDTAYIRPLYAKLHKIGKAMSFDLVEQSDSEEETPEESVGVGDQKETSSENGLERTPERSAAVGEQMRSSSEKGSRPQAEQREADPTEQIEAKLEDAPCLRPQEHMG